MLVKDIVNFVFVASLVINAALFLPQAFRLIQLKDSKELSLLTFGGFWLINLSIVAHAVVSQDWLLFSGTMLSAITSGWVLSLIVYYRIKAS